MVVHFTLLTITLFLSFLPKISAYKNHLALLRMSFFLIFIYAAIRYGYGNDYFSYYNMHDDIRSGLERKHTEVGFQFLLGLFPKYYQFIIFTSAIQSYAFYYLFKKYADREYYWFAFFMMFMQQMLMLENFAAMKSAICVYIFIFSIQFIIKKKPFHYFGLIYLATLFHTSSAILFPLYFAVYVSKINIGSYKFVIIMLSVFFFSEFLISLILEEVFSRTHYFDSYLPYNEYFDRELSIFGYIFLFPFSIIAWRLLNIYMNVSVTSRLFILIALFYVLIVFLRIDILGRFAMYLWPSFLIAIIILLKNTYDRIFRLGVILFLFLYSAIQLWSAYTITATTFLEYKTIFARDSIVF